MGLPSNTLNFILDNIHDIRGKRMLELGNQTIRSDVETNFKTGKEYFEALGVEHVSIDYSGKDGSLVLDLSKPIIGIGTFDIITNCGTSCYVDNVEECFRNMHRLCKKGGMIIHVLPEIGSKWSAEPKYDEKFAENLAGINGYEILKNYAIAGKHGKLRAIVFVKTLNNNFVWPYG